MGRRERGRGSLRTAAALALLLPLQAACGGGAVPREARPLADLTEELATAEIHREVPAIDVGTPESRDHLVAGWSWDESFPGDGDADETFAWGVGEASEVEVFLTEARPLEIRLRGRPFRFDGSPPQTVTVAVNGARVQRLVLDGGLATHALTLPEEVLRSGANRLTLRYGWSRSPESLGLSGDDRQLAVAWTGFRFDPVSPSAAEVEAVDEDDGPSRSELPFGAGVDYFLEIPAPTASRTPASAPAETETLLAIDNVSARGGTGFLTVMIQEAGAEPVRAAKVGPLHGSGRRSLLRLPLRPGGSGPDHERRLIRLGLRAVPREPGASGALVLTGPRLLTTAAQETGETEAAAHDPGDGGVSPETSAAAPGSASRPNVLVYLVDTLRADRVGVYRQENQPEETWRPSLTPRIDAFASGATVYEDAVAEAPWTRPTVASLLTGLPPLRHGVTTLESKLADEAVTLPELFRKAGYRTAAFSTNWHVTETTGMAQGFDHFVLIPEAVHAADLNRHVLAWLDRYLTREGSRPPLFLYVHALDPHAPYEPPERFRARFAPHTPPTAGSRPYLERIYAAAPGSPERTALMEPIPDLYDAEVAAVDAAFGDLLDALEERGLLGEKTREAVIAFVSDHGEGLDEHGHLGHGHDLYGEAIRVPMIVKRSGQQGGRIERTAQPSDLFDLLQGVFEPESPRPAFSHLDYEGRVGVSVVLGEWKAIEPLTSAFGRRPELYHRVRDPGERDDLAERHPVRLGYLRTLIRRHLRGADDGALAETTEIDAETRRGLEALGYL